MTSTFDTSAFSTSPSTSRLATPVVAGAASGAVAMTCCSVGILGASTWAAGVSAGFFAFGNASPIGSTPTFVLLALVLSTAIAWVVVRRQVRGLPSEVARASTRRAVGAALLTSGATYFVLMEFVMPVLFVTGALKMGQFFMH